MADAMVLYSSPPLDPSGILASDCMRYVQKNLDAQMQMVNQHKEAMSAIVSITKRTSRSKKMQEEGRRLRRFYSGGLPVSLLR
jgi:hypothetical protein